MSVSKLIVPSGSVVNRRKLPIILLIAISWTLTDFFLFIIRMSSGVLPDKYNDPNIDTFGAILLRELNVLLVSFIIGFLLVSVLRKTFRYSSLWVNLIAKTLILVLAGLIMTLFIHVSYDILIENRSIPEAMNKFLQNTFRSQWLIPKMSEWAVLYILTLLALEVNEKYSGSVFFDIMIGKYLQPREEKRIILFIDLRNSTPIAEKIGKDYFQFIRDFIFCISAGIMEHEGHIYQYVGDEIVAWWPGTKVNAKKAVNSLIESRKILNTNTDVFMRNYDIVPEYKAGMHSGTVTVGQVGISKKELVMSGDTINTASRIRSACNDLNQKFLVSKDVIDLLDLEDWQSESMGMVDMKGKNETMELFALKI
ncbi:MAG TPA: adenylate/guanylate cyclase domain-containing protein [Chitinophagaceae bacterium]|nr:adenylate/guanylate cyclase domain-containing protein [Chitinophagaceae bacterium]